MNNYSPFAQQVIAAEEERQIKQGLKPEIDGTTMRFYKNGIKQVEYFNVLISPAPTVWPLTAKSEYAMWKNFRYARVITPQEEFAAYWQKHQAERLKLESDYRRADMMQGLVIQEAGLGGARPNGYMGNYYEPYKGLK